MDATGTMTERPPRRGGLAGPAILIALGVVFLLNNLGYLSWGVWNTLLRLWPLLLIAIGLDLMLGRRSRLGSGLVALLMLAALVAVVWVSGAWLGGGSPLASDSISQPLGAARRGDVDIGMGAGTLNIGALNESDNLVEGLIATGRGERVVRDFAIDGDTATFKLRSEWAFPFGDRGGDRIEWNLLLNRNVPLRLHVSTGAGEAALDLARLQITRLDVNTGVGKTTLTLPRQGQVQARLSGGVGEATVIIPAGVAARVEATAGLGQVSVIGSYQREGKVYTSPGYDSAANRVDLVVSGGVGSITVRQESGR
jgi:cell wall-active antibiotic response 4TMS protein YvqF